MVKIKDFTLASKNRGAHAPVPYTPPAHACKNEAKSVIFLLFAEEKHTSTSYPL